MKNLDHGYTPKARPPTDKDWNNKSTFDNVLEIDIYSDIGDLIRELEAYTLGERLTPQNRDRLTLLKNHPGQYGYFWR